MAKHLIEIMAVIVGLIMMVIGGMLYDPHHALMTVILIITGAVCIYNGVWTYTHGRALEQHNERMKDLYRR